MEMKTKITNTTNTLTYIQTFTILKAKRKVIIGFTLEYYCGKCQLLFNKKSSFIDHIFVCGGFYHPESSHFILNQTKFNDVHWDHLMKLKDFQ